MCNNCTLVPFHGHAIGMPDPTARRSHHSSNWHRAIQVTNTAKPLPHLGRTLPNGQGAWGGAAWMCKARKTCGGGVPTDSRASMQSQMSLHRRPHVALFLLGKTCKKKKVDSFFFSAIVQKNKQNEMLGVGNRHVQAWPSWAAER